MKNIWCVIPLYNNAKTALDVALRCKVQMPQVLVVDDGSTDLDEFFFERLSAEGIKWLRHDRNRGKGAAILSAVDFLSARDADYVITIDADGQHFPEDLPTFLRELETSDDLFLIGVRDMLGANVPAKSRKGNAFGNFWFWVETGQRCEDCQSGFRAYPVAALKRLHFFSRRYNFETEALAKCAWGRLTLRHVPIRVHYDRADERVSHFRPLRDNVLISLMHTHLVLCRLLPWNPPDLRKSPDVVKFPKFFRHPLRFIKALLTQNSTPWELAESAFIGATLGMIPLLFFQGMAIMVLTARLRKNRIMALAVQQLYAPPIMPFVAIQVGHFVMRGRLLTEFSWQMFSAEWKHLIVQWIVGGTLLAVPMGLLTAGAVWTAANLLSKNHGRKYQAL